MACNPFSRSPVSMSLRAASISGSGGEYVSVSISLPLEQMASTRFRASDLLCSIAMIKDFYQRLSLVPGSSLKIQTLAESSRLPPAGMGGLSGRDVRSQTLLLFRARGRDVYGNSLSQDRLP